jgi:hypothetical protein
MTFLSVREFPQVCSNSCQLDWTSRDSKQEARFDTKNTTISNEMRTAQVESPKKAPTPLESIRTGDEPLLTTPFEAQHTRGDHEPHWTSRRLREPSAKRGWPSVVGAHNTLSQDRCLFGSMDARLCPFRAGACFPAR